MRAKVIGAVVGVCVMFSSGVGLAASPESGDDTPVPTTCYPSVIVTSPADGAGSRICVPSDFNDRVDEIRDRNSRGSGWSWNWWRFGIKPALFVIVAVIVQATRLAKKRRNPTPNFAAYTPSPPRPAPPPPPPFGQTPFQQPPPPPPPPPTHVERGANSPRP